MNSAFKRGIVFYSRIFLGIVFILSSMGKITDVKGFSVLVADYNLLPSFFVLPFSYILAWTEFFSGVFLLLGYGIPYLGIVVSGMMMMFITVVIITLVRGADIDCGCFDIPLFGSNKIGYHTLIRNIIFLLMSFSLIFLYKKEIDQPKKEGI